MRRLGGGLVAVALVLIGARVPDAHAASPSARARSHSVARSVDVASGFVPTRAALFGDSLSYQAKVGFTARMERRAPGDLSILGPTRRRVV